MKIERGRLQALAKLFAASTGPAPGAGTPAVSTNYFVHQSRGLAGRGPSHSFATVGKPTGSNSKFFNKHGYGAVMQHDAKFGIQPPRPQLLPGVGHTQLAPQAAQPQRPPPII